MVEDVRLRLAHLAGTFSLACRTSLEARKRQSLRLTSRILEGIGGIRYSKPVSIMHDLF